VTPPDAPCALVAFGKRMESTDCTDLRRLRKERQATPRRVVQVKQTNHLMVSLLRRRFFLSSVREICVICGFYSIIEDARTKLEAVP